MPSPRHAVPAARSTGLTLAHTVALSLVLALGLAACGHGDRPAPVEWTGVLFDHGALDPRLAGAWRAPGRGYLLEISSTGYTAFVDTGSRCYADPRGGLLEENLPAASQLRGTIRGEAETVQVYLNAALPPRFTIQRITAIPDDCRKDAATDPASVFAAFGEIFAQDYAFFAERGVDWQARLAAAAPAAAAATTRDELFAAMATALAGLGDAHTNLFSLEGAPLGFNAGNPSPTLAALQLAFERQTVVPDFQTFATEWAASVDRQLAAKLSGGSGPRLNGQVMWGRLPGDVGYLRIKGMDGLTDGSAPGHPALAEMAAIGAELDRAVAALADTQAIIVDVADNGGGEDAVSWEIAGRFADREHLAFTARFHRPQGAPDDVWTVVPRGPHPYLKPVYLLTSDLTASAAEGFTIMMRTLPNVVHAGQRTQGVFSEVVPKALPGGAFAVTLSTQRIVDASGHLFEGPGIPPSLPIPLFDPAAPKTLGNGHAAAIDALLAVIHR